MTPAQTVWFIIFAILLTMMILDKNFSEMIVLTGKLIDINIRRYILMAKLHPRNPVTNYVMKRKMDKLAEKLLKEQNNGN